MNDVKPNGLLRILKSKPTEWPLAIWVILLILLGGPNLIGIARNGLLGSQDTSSQTRQELLLVAENVKNIANLNSKLVTEVENNTKSNITFKEKFQYIERDMEKLEERIRELEKGK